MRVYLDHAATTPCDTEVIKAMEPYWQVKFGNPSSPHRLGGEAEEAIEQARAQVASLIGAESGEIIFTGSGTASDNLAIKGVAFKWQKRGRHIVTTQIEHPAVLESCRWLEKQNFKVTYLPVDEWGVVQVSDVAQVIREDTILVSIMHGNNEVGSIQPIEQISQLTSERGIYLHVDDVQTGGTLDPWLHGGQQENRWRASTQNVPGIVGFGRAAELVCERIVEDSDRLLILRDKLRDGLLNRIPDIRINGHLTERLPSNVNVSVAGVEGEGMVLHLDAAGIMCSTGSACSAHNLQPSHVLMAMGIRHEIAHGSLRFTLGRSTTEEEIDYVLEVLPAIVEKLRVMSPLVQERVA